MSLDAVAVKCAAFNLKQSSAENPTGVYRPRTGVTHDHVASNAPSTTWRRGGAHGSKKAQSAGSAAVHVAVAPPLGPSSVGGASVAVPVNSLGSSSMTHVEPPDSELT